MKKHVIFDFDDTMSPIYEHNQQLFVDTFIPYKPDIDQDYIRTYHKATRGVSMETLFQHVIDKFKLNISAKQLIEENEKIHLEKAIEVTVFDGFIDTLRHFKNLGMVLSICSNRGIRSLSIILESNKISQYFNNIISCSEAKHDKPDPYCLNELLLKYPKISKEETIYFGDSKTDADFAQGAGIDYIVIDHYLNKKQFYSMILNSFTGAEDEILTEINEKDIDIGSILKMEAHSNPDKFHRAAHVVLFNSSGNVILQQRSSKKMYDPNSWDIPGGHQTYGQSIEQTAEIELMEEMGIRGELKFVRKGFKQTDKQSEFYYLYYVINDGPYKINFNEVSAYKEFDCEKLLAHDYDQEYFILEHVYDYVGELKSVWSKLRN